MTTIQQRRKHLPKTMNMEEIQTLCKEQTVIEHWVGELEVAKRSDINQDNGIF